MKRSKILWCIFAVCIILCAVSAALFYIHCNLVVATTDGNSIIYNNDTYIEDFELTDIKKGICLGRVEFDAYGFSPKLYTVSRQPDHIYVDMGMDHRIYKKKSSLYEYEFIGKTSADIEKEFGLFDCVGMPADDDGLYRSCRCGYTVKEAKKGFWGTEPETLLFISFDENGLATKTEEGYRPGG